MGRRRGTTPLGQRRAQTLSDQDRYDLSRPRYDAFLAQAHWLLEQQQRRSAAFQQTAVALVGFDGVLLAVLASGDTIATVGKSPAAFWATIGAAVLILLSAGAGVMAILPRSTSAVTAKETVEQWHQLNRGGGTHDRDVQHFAEMLLAIDPPSTSKPTPVDRIQAWWRTKRARDPVPTQPLKASELLATARGTWTSRSGVLLVGGLLCVAVVLISNTVASAVADAPTDSATHVAVHETGEP